MDREKVIKGLECCLANRHNKCPYKSTDEGIDKVTCCTTYLLRDALALLKEQKAVRPKHIDGKHNHFIKCGNCNTDLMSGMKYCPQCGKAVKWE